MRHGYMLAPLLALLLLSACQGSSPYARLAAGPGNSGTRAPASALPDVAEEEEGGVVAYVFAENMADLPAPEGLFHDDTADLGDDEGVAPEPAFTWHQDGVITRCYQARDGRAAFCYQLANGTAIGAKNVGARPLLQLFRRLFERLVKPGKKGGAPSSPSPSAPVASGSRHVLASVEAWRKPVLTADKRIHPYRRTRGSDSPIPNLGLNRSGKTISDGRHTIRFDQNGFPRFNTKFETLLDDIHIGTGNRQAHIKAANENLYKAIQRESGLARELGLSVDDVAALAKSHQAPTGYRWHHHQDVGRMQLVKFEEHRLATPHTGGMAIWGGGYP